MKKYLPDIIFIVLAVLAIVFIANTRDEPKTKLTMPPYVLCQEGKTKVTGDKIYTCVNMEWVYTGQLSDIKG